MFSKNNINKRLLVLSLSAIASTGLFAKTMDESNVDVLNVSASLMSDEVERLPETSHTNGSQLHVKRAESSPTLDLAIPVGCTQIELTAAIVAGNVAGTAAYTLPDNCTYEIAIPATADEAFPIITGDISLKGGKRTVISRDPAAAQFRLFTVAISGTLRLENLRIENGDTTGSGGGVNNNGTLTLKGVTFENNNAANGGALAITAGASATVVLSTFIGNTTTSVGGGAALNFGNLDVRNSYFTENTAPVNGGAINNQGAGTTTLFLSLLTYNTSGSIGGALSNLGTLNVIQSIVNYNTGSSGGGIGSANTNVNISITSNTAVLENIPDNCSPLNTIPGCVN